MPRGPPLRIDLRHLPRGSEYASQDPRVRPAHGICCHWQLGACSNNLEPRNMLKQTRVNLWQLVPTELRDLGSAVQGSFQVSSERCFH